MGRIGKVIKSYIDKLSGSGTNAQFSSVEEFAGDQRTVQVFGPCNEDFAPPENCKTLNIPLGRGRGFLISAAYHNQQIEPVALPGERILYSTNQAGDTVMVKVHFKQDGTLRIENSSGYLELQPSGLIKANDAEIKTDGDIETSDGISLRNHTHPQGNDSDGDTEVDTGVPI
jgi:hypothetical protein